MLNKLLLLVGIFSVFSMKKLYSAYPLYPKAPKNETVVCLHGFLRTKWSMARITKYMQKEGYRVLNHGYPTRDKKIEEHGDDLIHVLDELSKKFPGQPIHFVTHSMGALVVRAAINNPACPEEAKKGRAVLLAPPNQGSAFGRSIQDLELVRWAAGPGSGRQLIETGEHGFSSLGEFPPSMNVLVIAGQYDNKVSLEEARLTVPHQFTIISCGHSLIMYNRKAIRIAKDFLSAKTLGEK